MRLVPDTNVWITILRGHDPRVEARYRSVPRRSVLVPSIVAAELYLGAEKDGRQEAFDKIARLLEPHILVPFGGAEMRAYARIRAHLERQGMGIGANDYIIAATALAAGATIVTRNVREFLRDPGPPLVDWLA